MHRYYQKSRLFQALAHPVRLQILEALTRQPLCVCELVLLTGRRQAYISQHLALLREVGLVCSERTGWNIFYRLCTTCLEEVSKVLCSFLPSVHADIQPIRVQGDDKLSHHNNSNNQWHGVPRAEIQWHPTVIADRCVGCGLCVTSCGRGVYAFDYEQNRPVVAAPEMCMVGCTTCATICTQDAIEFPSTGYIRQLIRQKKLLRQSKDVLKASREKYDVAQRQTTAG